jgi:hypothetical protein
MARKKNKEVLIANMATVADVAVDSHDMSAVLASLLTEEIVPVADGVEEDAEIAAILAAEEAEEIVNMEITDIVQATAEAHGAEEAMAQAGDAVEAQAEEEAVDSRSFIELRDEVTTDQVAVMQANLVKAFADRAAFERASNPNNDNIQKTLTKVQKGHLAHAISQGFVAAGIDANYLNKSEVTGKRRNVYALEKLQDLIYGASSGHLKNAINIAILASMVKLERAAIDFTGALAKAAASDKVAVETNMKALLVRHTVAEATASTQSSSTMTALEDLGAVVNKGTQKHPTWTFSSTPLAKRLKEVVIAKHLGGMTAAPVAAPTAAAA